MKKKYLFLFLFVFLIVIFWVYIKALLIPQLPACDYVTSGFRKPVEKQSCSCMGIKITVENSLPVDGYFKTVCLGKRK